MSAILEVVTTPTADTPGTAVVLRVGARRYVLGQFGEGLQRALIEQGQGKLTNTGAFCVTGRTEWAGIGGLFGMILSMADASAFAEEAARIVQTRKVENAEKEVERVKLRRRQAEEKARERLKADGTGTNEMQSVDKRVQEASIRFQDELHKAQEKVERLKKEAKDRTRQTLNILGAENIMHAIATARRFVFRKGLPLYAHEVKGKKDDDDEAKEIQPTWQDDSIRVWAMAVEPYEVKQDPAPVRSPGSSISRKRSIHEANGHNELEDVNVSDTVPATQANDDAIRSGVVADMFRSSWSLDQLVEQPISQIRLPATLFIRKPGGKGLEEYNGPLPGQPDFRDLKVWTRKPWPGALIRELPPTKPSKSAASYIVLSHPPAAKMDKQKLAHYKIPGPQIKDIVNGATVELADGQKITLDMITGASEPAKGIAVVDLPTEEYVRPLIEKREWSMAHIKAGVNTIIWILGQEVSKSPALREFIEQRTDVEHIIASPDHSANEITMESAAKSATRMNVVDPVRFHTPLYGNTASGADASIADLTNTSVNVPAAVHAARRGLGVEFSPKFAVRTEKITSALVTEPIGPMEVSEEVRALAQHAQSAIATDHEALERWRQNIPSPDAEVITLGTGSALPSKYRNVSSTLVRVPGVGSYLFDAGENTLGQLRRVFRPAELAGVLAELKMIWISHLHADHHLGTASVIRAWRDVVHNPASEALTVAPLTLSPENLTPTNIAASRGLAVVSDTGMLDWLAEYSQVEDFGYNHLFPLYIFDSFRDAPSHLTLRPSISTVASTDASIVVNPSLYPSLLGLADIQSVHVKHCHGAKAVALTFEDGFKVSYSGDCRPSKDFARIGKDSTVLIHEATFDDELAGEARAKAHSTTSEALKVGAAMNAKAVVLTHFSQRYQKIPVMDSWKPGSDSEADVDEHRLISEAAAAGAGEPDVPVNLGEDKVVLGAMMDAAEDLPRATLKRGSHKMEPALEPSGPMHTSSSKINDNTGDAVGTETASAQVDESTPGELRVKLKTKDMQVCVAFDYMRIKVGDIAQMKHFTQALVRLFEEREEEKDREKEQNKERAKQMEREKEERRMRNIEKTKMKAATDRANRAARQERHQQKLAADQGRRKENGNV